MGCVTRVTRTLEESEGVRKVTFEPQSETFLIEVSASFNMDDVAQRVRLAGQEHDAQLGLRDRPAWVLTCK